MQYIFLIGRQATWSRLEALRVMTKADSTARIIAEDSAWLLIETEQFLPPDLLQRLGGTERIGEVIGVKNDGVWTAEEIAGLLSPTARKFWLGVSVIQSRHDISDRTLKTLVNTVKKLIRSQGRSLKFILPSSRSLRLNAAQVIFNQLTEGDNRELLLVQGHNASWYLAQTIQVQDIQAYEKRDTAKPGRHAKAGMLPPKLAQMMINIAVSSVLGGAHGIVSGLRPDSTRAETNAAFSAKSLSILDPFCGTGTVVQEGWLMGHRMVGTDREKKMIDLANRNIAALAAAFPVDQTLAPRIFLHDATNSFPSDLAHSIDAIVTEPYLGPALPTPLSRPASQKQLAELGTLYRNFFERARSVLTPSGKIVFLLPTHRTTERAWSLFPSSFLDDIASLGYAYVQLIPDREKLVYARPDALVGRELTLWEKLPA